MLFSKKPIAFVRKPSILTRNQRSLFKIVRNILAEDKYDVMYARPAYHVFDVDERSNSKSNIKKGREMVGSAYLDIIVIENETLKAVLAFRMDENGDKKPDQWSKETQNLVMAAKSAKFPLFVVPDTKTFSTDAITGKINRVIPLSKIVTQRKSSSGTGAKSTVQEKNLKPNRPEVKVFHKTKP